MPQIGEVVPDPQYNGLTAKVSVTEGNNPGWVVLTVHGHSTTFQGDTADDRLDRLIELLREAKEKRLAIKEAVEDSKRLAEITQQAAQDRLNAIVANR